jgi:hypothetical protein
LKKCHHLKKLGINLYIDTTTIWNKYGIEYIGVHPEYRKKNETKIATLTDTNGDIISIINMMLNLRRVILMVMNL